MTAGDTGGIEDEVSHELEPPGSEEEGGTEEEEEEEEETLPPDLPAAAPGPETDPARISEARPRGRTACDETPAARGQERGRWERVTQVAQEEAAPRFNKIRADLIKRKTTTISVEVKKSQHKYIVGPKGNTLQEILDVTGVSVEMPSLESSCETIILRGEPDKLGPALTQVYAKAKSVTVAEVTAPAWLHRFIIGKKGQNIGRITQQLPKVHIEFTDGEETITLEGPTEEVQIAQTQIQDIINDLLTRMDYTEIMVEQKFHRHLIGKNGAN
ncbi:hypothetical protein scyTo_0021805, partial [Scyliorhinus torazame]|nr:hypothetical protein [Scyliorhinus torazame]